MKAKGSFYDSNERIFVDCYECERGKNGSEINKCASGIHLKKINQNGCFAGTLLKKLEVEKE